MQGQTPDVDRKELRAQLVELIQASNPELDGPLTDNRSLIRSGLLDSLGLFNLATFVERQLGQRIEFSSFDLSVEWDTINGILDFIERSRIAR